VEAQQAKGPMPPWHRFREFLAPGEHRALLDWAFANRDNFKPAGITGRGVDPSVRVAEKLNDLGPLKPVFEERLRASAEEIARRAGSAPFKVEYFELELAAHRDGAFFKRHSDIPFGVGREAGGDGGGKHDRVVSAVYYLHREPKAYSGGALRLFRFGAGEEEGDFVDIEPEQNSLVVFPSWAFHEVRPVSVPSGEFADSRFAVNVWLRRTLAAA